MATPIIGGLAVAFSALMAEALGPANLAHRARSSFQPASDHSDPAKKFILEHFGLKDDDIDVKLETLVPPAVQLAMDAPCAPGIQEIQEAGVIQGVNDSWTPDTPIPLPMFFILDQGVFDFSEKIACFKTYAFGDHGANSTDYSNKHVRAHLHEFVGDQLLLDRLASHPHRTPYKSEADFFIMGASLSLSYHAAFLDGAPCGDMADHERQTAAVLQALMSMPEFKAMPDRFVIVASDWNWQTIVSHELASTIATEGVILATQAVEVAAAGGVAAQNNVIVPSRPHSVVEDAVLNSELEESNLLLIEGAGRLGGPRRGPSDRPFSFATFADAEGFALNGTEEEALWESPGAPLLKEPAFLWNGEASREQVEGQLAEGNRTRNMSFSFYGTVGQTHASVFRYCMREIRSMLPGIMVKEVTPRQAASDQLNAIVLEAASVLHRSSFCFVPAGDAASAKQLVDAVAAGCVPIVFASMSEIAPNLPFRHIVDWTKLAIFSGDLSCVAESMGGTVYWLNRLSDPSLSKFNKATVEMMRMSGRNAFRQWLSYRRYGIAPAFLNELAELRNLTAQQRHVLSPPAPVAGVMHPVSATSV